MIAPKSRCLRVKQAGPGATLQDAGRFGYLRYGVTPAGPMDFAAFRTANLALGNDAGAAAVEIATGGFEVVCEGAPLWLAFAGGAFLWQRDGAGLPPAARIHLKTGERLAARAGTFGAFAYLAAAGGFDTPSVMGSRATHTRSGLGGIEGRMLKEGDLLPVAQAQAVPDFEAAIAAPWLARDCDPIRVVPGPQEDYFSPAARARFFGSEYRLTPAADRMAYRFQGPEIEASQGHDIVSDGVALGAIQIPGDRQPLVLMADRQPTGGYPKLGHVAKADIGCLAQLRPTETCRFRPVTADEARAALLALEDAIAGANAHLQPLRLPLTTQRLLNSDLIGGIFDPLGEL